jgi:TolA-binding protein
MVMEYVGREEHAEFAKRIDDEQHRQNKRIDSLEQTVKEISSLATSVEKLANNMANMVKEQEKQGKRLEALEGKDGEMWRTVVKYVLTTALGLVIGIVAMQIGLK